MQRATGWWKSPVDADEAVNSAAQQTGQNTPFPSTIS